MANETPLERENRIRGTWNRNVGTDDRFALYPSGNDTSGKYGAGSLFDATHGGGPSNMGYTEDGRAVGNDPKNYTEKSTISYAGTQPGYMGNVNAFKLPDRPEMPIFNAPVLEEADKFVGPDKPDTPTFNKPTYDQNEIAKLQSKAAAPGIRNLRETYGVIRSAARTNDPRGRQKLKNALSGYSKGLSEVIARSRGEAAKEYQTMYATTYDAAVKNWETEVQNTRLGYEGDFKAAENNWQAAVQHVRDKYAGQMETRKAEFQAEVDAVNMVYKAEVESEKTRYEGDIKTMIASYDNAWKGYLGTKSTTTTRTYGQG